MERRRRRRRLASRLLARVRRCIRWCGTQLARAGHAGYRLLRPWRPVVLVDARRSRARRLRRMLARAARAQFRALGVAPPEHLLVVVQRTVHGERPLTSLLQVFEDGSGARRHVLFLALSVSEESVSDGAIVATLRQQLQAVVGDSLGVLVGSVACAPPERRPAAVVPLHRINADAPSFEEVQPPDDRWTPVDDGYTVAAG